VIDEASGGAEAGMREHLGRGASRSPARQPWEAGYAVRRDWPDGTHEIIGFRWTAAAAARLLAGDRHYWRRGPLRPSAWAMVVVSRRDFDLHARRPGCRSPDCPAAATVARHRQALP
jgi:hypothetical protein